MKSVIITMGVFFLTCSAWAGTFVETFDNKDLEGWKEIVWHDEAPGSWENVDGELHVGNNDGFLRLLTIGDKTWRNYTVEFDVKPLKKHGSGSIAIAARIRGTSVLWCMIGDALLPGPEARAICYGGNLHSNTLLFIASKRSSFLKLNKWSTLKLSVQENNLTFWINGELLLDPMEIPDIKEFPALIKEFTDFSVGGAGFGVSGYTARFDNITITGEGIPNKGGLAVKPNGKIATTWGELKVNP
ncbi:MAG: DUF1080 domain-containing protein [Candidatus Poribacteria bacterium]|nr:DUF1080 domain-containing protein [Candidatus Poribacteria bacterium]